MFYKTKDNKFAPLGNFPGYQDFTEGENDYDATGMPSEKKPIKPQSKPLGMNQDDGNEEEEIEDAVKDDPLLE